MSRDYYHRLARASQFAKTIEKPTHMRGAACAHWAHRKLQRLFMVHWRAGTSTETHGLPRLLEYRKGEVRRIIGKIRATYLDVHSIEIIKLWFYNVDAPACGLPSTLYGCVLMAREAREAVRASAAYYLLTKEDTPWSAQR